MQGLEATASDIAAQNIFDGVIIDFRNFGTCCGTLSQTYNLGRTTTHEVGHWLGLLHTTADEACGNDFCDDTPQIESLNLNTTCVPINSNCSGVQRANMIENYMDYSPDRCMNIFTNDQKTRSRLALDLSLKRKRLLASLEYCQKQIHSPLVLSRIHLKILHLLERNLQVKKIFIFSCMIF